MTESEAEAFGLWLGLEARALTNGISAIIKEGPERSLASTTTGGYSEKKKNKMVF